MSDPSAKKHTPSAPEGDEPRGEENAPNRPLWRNPWLLAFLVGIAFVHLIRPFTRHVPEPPPVHPVQAPPR